MKPELIDKPDVAPGNDGLAALNKNDFAARYDVSKRTLDTWLAAGCPHLKLSSRMIRIPVQEGDKWVKETFFQQRREVSQSCGSQETIIQNHKQLKTITSPLIRARDYIATAPGAASGASGHNQTIAVACKLVRFGLAQHEVWTLLCEYNQRCTPPWSERDLRHKLNDAFRLAAPGKRFVPGISSRSPVRATKKIDPATAVENFLKGFRCSPCDLIAASTCKIPPLICGEHFHRQGAYLLDQLFQPSELVNVVTKCLINDHKAQPGEKGLTLPCNEWEERLLNPVTWQVGGAWVRMNPLDGKGVADANVTAFRFALIEFDDIPLELQLSLLAKLPLPIAAVLSSGGRSIHAWVKVDCKDAADYLRTVSRMLAILARFGVDTKNKNPSRLSRLPGVKRSVGATGDGRQQLYYLNPNPEQRAIL